MPDFKLKILKHVAFISLTFFYWETMAQDKSGSLNQKKVSIVPEAHMQKIFEEIKTHAREPARVLGFVLPGSGIARAGPWSGRYVGARPQAPRMNVIHHALDVGEFVVG